MRKERDVRNEWSVSRRCSRRSSNSFDHLARVRGMGFFWAMRAVCVHSPERPSPLRQAQGRLFDKLPRHAPRRAGTGGTGGTGKAGSGGMVFQKLSAKSAISAISPLPCAGLPNMRAKSAISAISTPYRARMPMLRIASAFLAWDSLRPVSGGVVFSKLSKLLNQEDALGAPWLQHFRNYRGAISSRGGVFASLLMSP
jgi:hypothetical protein